MLLCKEIVTVTHHYFNKCYVCFDLCSPSTAVKEAVFVGLFLWDVLCPAGPLSDNVFLLNVLP